MGFSTPPSLALPPLLGLEQGLEAVADAQLVVELEAYRETGHVLLMRAHAAAGDPAQALAAYERLRVRLAEELGASPSAETESAFLEILAR